MITQASSEHSICIGINDTDSVNAKKIIVATASLSAFTFATFIPCRWKKH